MLNDYMKIIAEQQSQRVVLKGKTIKYNQLNQNNGETRTANGITATKNSDNSWTINGTATQNTNISINGYTSISLTESHKYLFYVSNSNVCAVESQTYNTTKGSKIINATSSQLVSLSFFFSTNESHNNDNAIVYFIDLTSLGLDTITTLADFYATDLGKAIQKGSVLPYSTENKLMSVKSAFTFKREVEYNQLLTSTRNTTTDSGVTISVSADKKTFTCNGTASADITFFINTAIDLKANNNYALFGCPKGASDSTYSLKAYYLNTDYGNGSLSMPQADRTGCYAYISIKSGTTCNNLVFKPMLINLTQLNLSISSVADFYKTELGQAIKNGMTFDYSPTNKMGNAIKPTTYIRTKRVDLGTLNWTYSANGYFYSEQIADLKLTTSNNELPNIKCSRFTTTTRNNWLSNKQMTQIANDNRIYVFDNEYTDATTFKASLSGVILEYETAEPLELNGIDNLQDTFANHNGKVVRKFGKVKLKDLSYTLAGRFFIVTTPSDMKTSASSKLISNRYETGYVPAAPSKNGIFINTRTNDLVLRDNNYSTASALKNSFTDNDYLYYELKNETTEYERSVLVDSRYTKVVDANDIVVEYNKI